MEAKAPLSEMQVVAFQKEAKAQILKESLTPSFIRMIGYDAAPKEPDGNHKTAADIIEAEKCKPSGEEGEEY